MTDRICVDWELMARNLIRCSCRDACDGCMYQDYGRMCEDYGAEDSCIDRMLREAAMLLDPNSESTIGNLQERDFRERRPELYGKNEEADT